MATQQLGRNPANKQLACRKRFVTKRKNHYKALQIRLCGKGFLESESKYEWQLLLFSVSCSAYEVVFLSGWLTQGHNLPLPCLRWAPLAPHHYFYLFFQTWVSSTESTQVRVQIHLTELLLDGLLKSWQSNVPKASDKSFSPFWYSWKFILFSSLTHVSIWPSSLPYRILPGFFFRQSLLFLCYFLRRSPSVTVAATVCSWKTCLSLRRNQLVRGHLTRWTNAWHTCLLITTYFQFPNCQAQYSGTSFPGSGIAELIQNPLLDIYHTAHSASHIYHVQALLIHLGERYTVVSAVQWCFQMSSGRNPSVNTAWVCLISHFQFFFVISCSELFLQLQLQN